MPRKPLIRSNKHFYHLTARSNNKENFYLPIATVWKIMISELAHLQQEYQVEIMCFVLMNNHFHLMLRTPNLEIEKVMYFFMKRTTLKIQKKSLRINRVFGGRYKGCIILDESYYKSVYRYIYQNPLKAGLDTRAQDYLYSTLFYEHYGIKLPFELSSFDTELLESNKYKIHWINTLPNPSKDLAIKMSLKKTIFKIPKNHSSGKTVSIS